MRRHLALLLASVTMVAMLTGCGEKKDVLAPAAARSVPLRLMLDGPPGAEDVGVYRALSGGDFAQAALTVTAQSAANAGAVLDAVAAGRADVGISTEPQLLISRDQGQPLVGIGAVVQRPLVSLLSLGAQHIASPAQLRGKTVGDGGTALQRAFLSTIVAHAGLPPGSVRQTMVPDLIAAMESKRVNATLGATWNRDAVALRQQGRRVNAVAVDRAGVPAYDELVLVTTENELANHTGALRRFVQALGRGYESARADPQAGVAALLQANPSLGNKLTSAQVSATLPAFFPSRANVPWGWQLGGQWNAFGQWMLREHLIRSQSPIVASETNQLLAGQGP